MFVTRAARPTLAAARSARAVRFAHFENVTDQTIPGGSKKTTGFALRMIVFGLVGAGLPFAAAKFQMAKAGGEP
ncbi:hypothetical protein CcaverHIS002_0600560 [Cutaneotrichosporon cavernicola]|uniref:Cytochrome c oxidase subunit 8, mitochondrial n=1 Tax=Cutaneotrichosporon cavernicola TaxID=279322 RepID=A0AA48L5S1_9TREE|nr:uncharacterized protein CcaverHIS019_0500650 [Cutaneotrichosporon cavernicola]BEI85769.1 hypothetical protein CcaverHIS002_0600560 [Cutaneotrichosporon cavernicola]BEI92437.1 hypothetical protein CcaverHIS019_0500650 [Cutaneotrichosporon cavernicola]BEJ00210.1 hypothetical protein CcaverHIS631_0500670 [Cutaneotrichosporon cavernicola]BEJ07981.1 hypothetical protein CcaverHIS641_0500660 [Cutaneotrichosporon cavernicola]